MRSTTFPQAIFPIMQHMVAQCQPAAWAIPLNVRRTAEGLEFQLGLPGVGRDQIALEVKDEQLLVTINVPEDESQETTTTWLRRELFPKSQVRRFDLPPHVDAGAITAKMTDGLLTIALPFQKDSLPRKIDIVV
jgi:HSP20 family molecular chaperone IbpA